MIRARRLAAALLIATAFALIGASSAEARYCGKVRAYRVYSTGVTCTTAKSYIRRDRCPAGWKRFDVTEEFGFETIGYGCRRGKRRFSSEHI
jgi:hypothetical protein